VEHIRLFDLGVARGTVDGLSRRGARSATRSNHEGEWDGCRITVDSKSWDYFITPVASDYGQGYLLEKIGHEEAYHVYLHGQNSSRECLGHLRHNKPCKHIDGLAALVAANRL
jgi:hypothetical protein